MSPELRVGGGARRKRLYRKSYLEQRRRSFSSHTGWVWSEAEWEEAEGEKKFARASLGCVAWGARWKFLCAAFPLHQATLVY